MLNSGALGGDAFPGGIVFNPAAVPEPSTWALTLAGLLGLAVIARRRQTGASVL